VSLDCPREQDVLDAVATGRWPGRADGELRDHVRGCAICADVAEIAGPLLAERDAAWDEAPLPPSTLVWWRAQVRAREEAARAAARPIALVQAIGAAGLGAAAFVLIPLALPWMAASVTTAATFAAWLAPRALDVSRAFALATGSTTPLLALGAWVVLAPLLLYVALADD
jgi:hypothetical protein